MATSGADGRSSDGQVRRRTGRACLARHRTRRRWSAPFESEARDRARSGSGRRGTSRDSACTTREQIGRKIGPGVRSPRSDPRAGSRSGSAAVVPWKARLPVSISKSTARRRRGPSDGRPEAAHLLGGHVATVPSIVPGVEPVRRASRSSVAPVLDGRPSLAMPKSRILTRPSLRQEQVLRLEVAVDDALARARRRGRARSGPRSRPPCARRARPSLAGRGASRPRSNSETM